MAGYYIPLVGTPQIGDSGGGGGGAGGMLVNVTRQGSTSVCDKTAGEIMAVVEAGGSVVFKAEGDSYYTYEALSAVETDLNTYDFTAAGTRYSASSADDYPTHGGK